MPEADAQERAMEILIAINTAVINLRLYPPTNAMIANTIDRLYNIFSGMVETNESITFAESEKRLLVSGAPLSQKYQEKPQVAIFLMLMLNWGLKSIEFKKGLEKKEIIPFLQLLSKKPDGVTTQSGLDQIVSSGEIPNIILNQKIYVAKGKDQEIISSIDLKDEDIIKFITKEDFAAISDPDKLKEKAKDPEWISQIFKAGIGHLTDGGAGESAARLSENVLYMLRTIDSITDSAEKTKISQMIAGNIAEMDAEFISVILSQNIEGLLDDTFLNNIIDKVDMEKFEKVVNGLRKNIDASKKAGKEADQLDAESIGHTYEKLMDFDKGIELKRQIKEREAREREEREEKIRLIKEKSLSISNELEKADTDIRIIETVPDNVSDLFEVGELQTADAIIEKLIGKLLSDSAELRAAASEALGRIFESISIDKRTVIIKGKLETFINWIKVESVVYTGYAPLGLHIRDYAHQLIRNKEFGAVVPIINALQFSSSEAGGKSDDVRLTASRILQEIASDEALNIILNEFRTDKDNRRQEAGKALVALYEFSLPLLLDLLAESEQASERILILNLIPEIGKDAGFAVIQRIEESAPWYYLRNLARLMGRVGVENQVGHIAHLLLYDDERVQKEALKSISAIGGSKRGEIFIDALNKCHDSFKAQIITAVGNLKQREAVKPLMDLFHSKATASSEVKNELQEKICLALGSIGDTEALPLLTEISKQSGFFSLKSYGQNVKMAASKAIGTIMSKQRKQ